MSSIENEKEGSSHDEGDSSRAAELSRETVSSTASALVISACDKAGMEGIDRARIDAIILRESGDSAFMKQQRKRDQNVNEKIEQMKKRLAEKDARNSPSEWRQFQEVALESEINDLLSLRRTRSTCVVVDMDSFYISCELLTKPELKNVPACVGGSMILTSNYYARRYGVRSAMAGWIGDKLVSELSGGKEKLIHIPSNFELYTQLSHKVREVMSEYDPNMRAYSLDEAYLDIGPYVALKLGKGLSHEQIVEALSSSDGVGEKSPEEEERGEESELDDGGQKSNHEPLAAFPQELSLSTAAVVVQEMRQRVHQATGGLTCSAGLASNFMLAKIASDHNKPNGQMVVPPSHDDVLSFIRELPIRKIPGIGRVTEKMLHAFDIFTVKHLYDQRAVVRFLFKPATAHFLLRASLGCSSSDGANDDEPSERKGISRERTFRSGQSWAEVNSRLEDIARKLSGDMKEKDLKAHTITVKVKLHTFDVMSRSRTMARGVYLQDADTMVSLATEMLLELKKQHKGGTFSVRLLGVRCSNFQGEEEKTDSSQMDIQQYLCSPTRDGRGGAKQQRSRSPSLLSAQPHAETQPQDQAWRHFKAITDKEEGTEAAKSSGESEPLVPCGETAATTTSDRQDESKQEWPLCVTCPMCNQQIAGQDNGALNRHIDSCLNASMIRKAIREESSAAAQRQHKKQRLTDFFGAS